MSFHERSAIALMIASVLAYGLYLARAAGWIGGAPLTLEEARWWLAGAVTIMVILTIIAHAALGIMAVRAGEAEFDTRDERDRLIHMRANASAGLVATLTAVLALNLALLRFDYLTIAHHLLGGLLLSEVVRIVRIVVQYRRGVMV